VRDPLALCEAMAGVLQQLDHEPVAMAQRLSLARANAEDRFSASAVALAYVREYESAIQQHAGS